MAKSAASYYEVRWRLKDSDEAWSTPQRVKPADDVVVEGLDRSKTYEFEARAVSNCGAKSDWVPSDHTVPDAPAGTLTLADLKTEADQAASDAAAANAELANIASDGVLTAGEKPTVIRDYNVITTEQAGIDAQATAYAITTAKTTYDNAVTALSTYLGTLTSPVLWSNLTGNTTIVGATFRQKFADVYTARQSLLNAIYAAAKAKAQAAQDAADAAQGTADTAKTVAIQLPIVNPNFDATPAGYGWVADAGSGWVTDASAVIPGGAAGCAKHVGSSSTPSGSYRNISHLPCQPGQMVKYQALIQAIGANGYCTPTISFESSPGVEITSSHGATVTGTGITPVAFNATAPAGTTRCVFQLTVSGHTAGTYLCDNLATNLQPASLDEVPDGTSRYGAIFDPSAQGGMYKPGDNMLRNPNGRLGMLHWGSAISGQPMVPNTTSFGTPCFRGVASGDQGSQADPVAVGAGVQLVLSGEMYTHGITGGTVQVFIQFLNSSGAEIAGTRQSISANLSIDGWNRYSLALTTPTGTASTVVFMRANPTGGGLPYWRNLKLEVGSVLTPFNDWATQNGNELTQAGSGRKLGDQLNAPNSLTLNYGAVRSATALTATSAGAVSVNAFTYYMGATSVHYNAVSNAVTGLIQNSTYQIYCHDSDNSGGTKSWAATTNAAILLQTYDDIVVAGQVTIPTSGTSGGGGTGAGCPVVDAWVVRRTDTGREYARAGSVRVGDYLLKVDGEWGLVTFSERKRQPCVRVVAGEGRALSCSRSAPLGLALGGSVLAPDARRHILRGREGSVEASALIERVEDLEDQWVQHITCEDDFYLVGDHPAFLFSHHNLKPS